MIGPVHQLYTPKKFDLNNSVDSILLLGFALRVRVLFEHVQKASDRFALCPAQRVQKPGSVTCKEYCITREHACSFAGVQLLFKFRPFHPIGWISIIDPIREFLPVLRIVAPEPSSKKPQQLGLFNLTKLEGMCLQFR